MSILHYTKPEEAIAPLKSLKQYSQAVILWGRFQPPHIGHLTNFKNAHSKYHSTADIYIIPSSTCERKQSGGGTKRTANASAWVTVNNPYTIKEKLQLLKLLLDPSYKVLHMGCNNIVQIIDTLFRVGYDEVIMYLGADRLDDFNWIEAHIPENKKLSFVGDSTRMTTATQKEISSTQVRKAIYYEQKEVVKELLGNPIKFEEIWSLLVKNLNKSLTLKNIPSTLHLTPGQKRAAYLQRGGFLETFYSTLYG